MRIAARKASNGTLPRREQLALEQQRAASLHKQFPEIERLRIELVFSDPQTHAPPPSTQLHTLYSAASAFFRFSCPCADCDGEFDLTESVSKVVASATTRRRSATLGGQLSCHGHRFPTHTELRADCPMQLKFQLVSEPHPAG